jgi:fatty acid desaturase
MRKVYFLVGDAMPEPDATLALREAGLPRHHGLIFAYSSWDAIPVALGILHFLGVALLALTFSRLSWPVAIACGVLYAVSISWSINSVSHNFIHNPFFVSHTANRAFSVLLSVTLGFSQEMYRYVHLRHHSGNMDRKGLDGSTVDYLSFYRHSVDDRPESPWRYVFLSYFRDDPREILRRIRATRPADARFAQLELATTITVYLLLLLWDWRAVVCLVPFYYLGHSLSSLNGYYEHFGADPDRPIAWGVSCYGRLYNWTWLYNGYHAEHHYRPKMHWTRMVALHRAIAEEQRRAGVRVLRVPHALGFLEAGSAQK